MPPSPQDPRANPPVSRLALSDILDWAIWFGAATALGETVVVALLRTFTTRLVFITRDIIWRGPISNILLYAVLGLLLAAFMRRRSRATALGALAAIFVFCGVVGPLLQVPRLHPYAALLLAAGVAVQAMRFTAGRPDLVGRAVRSTRTVLAVTCVVLALGFFGFRWWHVRQAKAQLRPAPDAPNIVLIVLDTVRAQSLGIYGNARATSPRIDAFAKTGVRFDHALVQAPWTLPSHASLFTARLPHELSADWLRPLDGAAPTLAEALQDRGYVTAGEVANLLYATSSTGLDRGFLSYADFPFSVPTLMHQSWVVRPLVSEVRRNLHVEDMMVRKSATEVTDNFLGWMKGNGQRPFFAFLNYFDAHAPYRPPAPYDTMFAGSTPLPDMARQREWSAAETQRFLDAYEGAVAYVDAEVGRVLDALAQQGVLEHTIVIVTSDHGEQFGEHQLFDHANSLYRPLLHVPLIVAYPPAVPANRAVEAPVAMENLAATILELAGGRDGGRSFGGSSLARYWAGGTPPEDTPVFSELSQGINTLPWLPVSKGRMASVVLNGWHYIRNGDGSEELYDFRNDVAEATNRATDPGVREALDAARAAVASRLPPR